LEADRAVAEAQRRANDAPNEVRRNCLQELHKHTGRNVIAYYSGFLSKRAGSEINDEDKNGFMQAVHKMDKKLGLDLILHTEGGRISATQSLVDYLRRIFKKDIRAIVPQIAMSGGTMLACACREIWMCKHSNLGPIDPQFNGIPCVGVKMEFERAFKEIKKDPEKMKVWAPILQQYHPTFLGECENAIKWSNDFVQSELENVMFEGEPHAKATAKRIVSKLSSYKNNKSHDKHIDIDELKDMGLKIKLIEDIPDLQDCVLPVHHCYMHFLMNTGAFKIIAGVP
jgi:ClpP class serine protease